MNTQRITDALNALRDAILEGAPGAEDWSEFGRATAAAIRDGYVVESVSRAESDNFAWRPAAHRLWLAAGRVGLHGVVR